MHVDNLTGTLRKYKTFLRIPPKMTLKDLLKKKDKVRDEGNVAEQGPTLSPDVPEFQFYRTTTSTRESIEPPTFPGDPTRASQPFLSPAPEHRGFKGRFRRHSNAAESGGPQESEKGGHKLHFGRNRSASSVNVPENLPAVTGDGVARNEEEEANWEKRATVLISGNTVLKSGGNTPTIEVSNPLSPGLQQGRSRSGSHSVSAAPDDADIQEAIRLHEAGDFAASTKIFGKLADPNGANNALSQVLYGLALRHGWGCEPDMSQAVRYLSVAASNSAEVERLALQAGMKKGGAAKGELVIAMFELGNCFRYAWGTKKDPVAAKQYYETAANLGDTDAMNEVAWCYLEGFGTKKDKFKAAQFLRLAESKGSKTIGNTW
ncbi:hypothetical protein SLS60_005676 [Paraconiothyrium brasiliense]|uniref:HCP-like protein n=1 Tax=Paraconiothyrium brasiliense TaxID=300254 RepID=A0ABR3RI23_9PLEO